MQQLEGFYSKVQRQHDHVADIKTEVEIRAYLCNIEHVDDWLLVCKAMSRMQNGYVALESVIAICDECKNRATALLNLGVLLIEQLTPILADLKDDAVRSDENANGILFAMQMRLNAINTFQTIYMYWSSSSREDRSSIVAHQFEMSLWTFKYGTSQQMNVAEAYPGVNKPVYAILIAVTLTVIVLCIVPMVLAWQRSSPARGSKNDADFWAGFLTMSMQLLNLFTMMFPISRFAPVEAWRLAWMFAALAGLCAIACPILYVRVSGGWSLLVVYIGSAAQAAVVLQIMLNANFTKEKSN